MSTPRTDDTGGGQKQTLFKCRVCNLELTMKANLDEEKATFDERRASLVDKEIRCPDCGTKGLLLLPSGVSIKPFFEFVLGLSWDEDIAVEDDN